MTGRRFLTDSGSDAEVLVIDGEEFHHLARVMRARPGMEMEAVNGRGDWFLAEITRMAKGRAEARVLSRKREESRPARLIMAPSILRKRPMDLMLEKLCELGVDEIRPVCFSRSDADCPGEVPDRWRRVALQAIKVNRRLRPTRILPPAELSTLLETCPAIPGRLVLEIAGPAMNPDPDATPLLCVIGPPGDFTSEESAALREAEFASWRINPGVLRTETAAIAAAAMLQRLLLQGS